jgi:hypothetical protein
MLASSHGVRQRLVEALRDEVAPVLALPILRMTAMRRIVLQVFWWRRVVRTDPALVRPDNLGKCRIVIAVLTFLMCANVLLPSSSLVAPAPIKNHLQPQESNCEEWEKVEEYIPLTQTRWNSLNVNRGLPTASRTVHDDAHSPKLLGIKRHFGLILDTPTDFPKPGRVAGFSEPAVDRLNSYLHRGIAWNCTT